ncbi:MAG: hypothetical protein NVS3B18_15210 [Candidatus Dormibacteria bacterium]
MAAPVARHSIALLLLASGLAACAGDAAGGATPAQPARVLMVSPQNSEYLVGIDRVSLALFDGNRRPISGAKASVEVQAGPRGGAGMETRPLEDIGPQYGGIPIYVTTARFPKVGIYKFVVHAALSNGSRISGQAFVTVTTQARELPIGHTVPALRQPIMGDPGVTIEKIDSGVPPDPWHTATIADGLAQHKPMVLYFGEPGFCKSRTCGPTVAVLQQLEQQVGASLLFEHIEDHYPAGPDETSTVNPAFTAFGLQTDPWVFFVNSNGVVSDRFEGPVTVAELMSAAEGTLAGKVPAVDVSLGK